MDGRRGRRAGRGAWRAGGGRWAVGGQLGGGAGASLPAALRERRAPRCRAATPILTLCCGRHAPPCRAGPMFCFQCEQVRLHALRAAPFSILLLRACRGALARPVATLP